MLCEVVIKGGLENCVIGNIPTGSEGSPRLPESPSFGFYELTAPVIDSTAFLIFGHDSPVELHKRVCDRLDV